MNRTLTYLALLMVTATALAAETRDTSPGEGLPFGCLPLGGQWEVVDGRLIGRGKSAAGAAMLAVADTGRFTDGRVSADLTVLQVTDPSRWVGLMARYDATQPERWAQFISRQDSPSGPELALNLAGSPGWRIPAKHPGRSELVIGRTYRFELTVRDGLAVGTIDGQELVRTDGLPVRPGYFGISCSGAEVAVDNLVVVNEGGRPSGGVPGEVLLREDFAGVAAGELPTGWQPAGGSWQVVDGWLRGVADTYLSQIVLPVGSLTDVAIEADVRFLSAKNNGRWVALTGRKAVGQPAPFCQFTQRFDRTQSNGLELGLRTGDERWRILRTGSAPVPPLPGVTVRARFELRGEQATGYLDGVPVMNVELPAEAVQPGEVSLLVSECTVEFKHVVVEALPPLSAEEREAIADRGRGTPLLVAHRGSSGTAPENTLVAITQAFDEGAEAVEVDLRISADGQIVLLHDATVDRTTNGTGACTDLTVAQLQALDAGSWKDPRFAGERIPTLAEALAVTAGRGVLLLDLKVPRMAAGIAAAYATAVNPPGLLGCCWTDAQIADWIAHLPEHPMVKLGGAPKEFGPSYFSDFRLRGVSGFSYGFGSLTPEFMRAAKLQAMSVYTWTVNDPAQMEAAALLGVDGILTDFPVELGRVLRDLHRRRMARD